jgi:ornithine carbamoyltransferase
VASSVLHRVSADTPVSVGDVLDTAAQLQVATQAGQPPRPLRGKHLALMGLSESADARRFRNAALALGATLSQIGSDAPLLSSAEQMRRTARTLGLLYNAVECQGLPAELVAQLRMGADIPVFDGLASSTHAVAQLAAQIEGPASLADKWLLVVQAVLLCTIT